MRTVIQKDKRGLKHRYLVPDDIPDHQAQVGISQDPPPFLELLDWDALGRELWNAMVDQNIIDWKTHQDNPGMLATLVKTNIMNPLINLLKAETRNSAVETSFSENGKPQL